MGKETTFYLTNEDLRNLQHIRHTHPNWSDAVILRKALAVYAASLHPSTTIERIGPTTFDQTVSELYG